MDLAKVHEGHVRVLEAQLLAQRQALSQASQKEGALNREREAVSAEAKQLQGRLATAAEQLELRKQERREAQDLVRSRFHGLSCITSEVSCACTLCFLSERQSMSS